MRCYRTARLESRLRWFFHVLSVWVQDVAGLRRNGYPTCSRLYILFRDVSISSDSWAFRYHLKYLELAHSSYVGKCSLKRCIEKQCRRWYALWPTSNSLIWRAMASWPCVSLNTCSHKARACRWTAKNALLLGCAQISSLLRGSYGCHLLWRAWHQRAAFILPVDASRLTSRV